MRGQQRLLVFFLYRRIFTRKFGTIGTIAAQVIHASGESASALGKRLPANTHAIALSVPSEGALLELEERLLAFGIPHFSVREPDFFNQLMAIGFLPAPKGTYKKFLAKLSLLKTNKQPTL